MEVSHVDQTKDVAEREERGRITGFAKAEKSWTSHPTAQLWGRGCFACSLDSTGEHAKTWCWGWAPRLLAPALMWSTGSRA